MLNEPIRMLPIDWIERIFDRMSALYGSKFLDLWRTSDITTVKGVWAEELAGFCDKPEAIARALKNLSDGNPFPPTLPEFVRMCRDAAKAIGPKHEALPHKPTAADQARAKEAAAKVGGAINPQKERDHLAWAKKPASPIALAVVIDLAKTDIRFAKILEDLRADGTVEGDRLIRFSGGAA